MLRYGVDNALSTHPFVIISTIYKLKFKYPGGEMSLIENNYIVATHYGFLIDNAHTATLKYTFPANNFFSPDSIYGDILNTTCNITLYPEVGEGDAEYINIGLIQHIYNGVFEDKMIRKMIELLFKDTNNRGGILDKFIQIIYLNIDDDDTDSTISEVLILYIRLMRIIKKIICIQYYYFVHQKKEKKLLRKLMKKYL